MLRVQNLSDGKRATWRDGRGWWGRLSAEWSVFYRPSLAIGFSKGGHVCDGTGIQFHIALLLFNLYLTFDTRKEGKPYRELTQRELSVTWFMGDIQLHLWTGDDDWIRDRPWHRNCVCIHVKEWFTGSPRSEIIYGEPFKVVIPMPEGCYEATAKSYKQSWTYRFGFKKTINGFDFNMNPCIPFSGKGENSWDCGDDGLCGFGPSGTLEEGIGKVVTSVLSSRKRYGTASHLVRTEPVMAKG